MIDLLNKVAVNAMSNWWAVGFQLGIGKDRLDIIQKNSADPIVCYSEVFSLWQKRGEPPFTWATIVGTLKAPIVGENKLAADIACEQALKTDKR